MVNLHDLLSGKKAGDCVTIKLHGDTVEQVVDQVLDLSTSLAAVVIARGLNAERISYSGIEVDNDDYTCTIVYKLI